MISTGTDEQRSAAQRAHHLIDIENVCDGQVTEGACATFRAAYNRLVGPLDHVVVGGTPSSLRHTFALGSWRRVVGRPGPDGADQALMEALPDADRLSTFTALVICSGDHAFVEAAHRARAKGVTVVVVAPSFRGMSRELRQTADLYIPLNLQVELAA